MSLLRNLKTVLSSPAVAADYVSYQFQRVVLQQEPTRTFWGTVHVGGFTSFSEFHTSRKPVSAAEHMFFSTLTLSDGVVVDVGANLGIVTSLLGSLWPDRPIHSFEPAPSTFDALQTTVALNDLSNVTLNNAAVGAEAGMLSFQTRPSSRATAKLVSASHVPNGSANGPTISVPTVSLDAYAKENAIDQIAILKVDVEGFEPLVFEGAERLLSEQRIRLIYFELCPPLLDDAGFAATRPGSMLREHGYDLFRIVDGPPEPVSLKHSQSVSLENWVAVPPGERPWPH